MCGCHKNLHTIETDIHALSVAASARFLILPARLHYVVTADDGWGMHHTGSGLMVQ